MKRTVYLCSVVLFVLNNVRLLDISVIKRKLVFVKVNRIRAVVEEYHLLVV